MERLAILHRLTASSGSGTLLTSLSRFKLLLALGFPGMEMAPPLLEAEEQVEHMVLTSQPWPPTSEQVGGWVNSSQCVYFTLLEPTSLHTVLNPSLILCHEIRNACFLTSCPLPPGRVNKMARKLELFEVNIGGMLLMLVQRQKGLLNSPLRTT